MSTAVIIPSLPEAAHVASIYAVGSDSAILASFNIEQGKRYNLSIIASLGVEGTSGFDVALNAEGSTASWRNDGASSCTIAERSTGSAYLAPSPVQRVHSDTDRSANCFVRVDQSSAPFVNGELQGTWGIDCYATGELVVNVRNAFGYASQVNVYKALITLTELSADGFIAPPPPPANAD